MLILNKQNHGLYVMLYKLGVKTRAISPGIYVPNGHALNLVAAEGDVVLCSYSDIKLILE